MVFSPCELPEQNRCGPFTLNLGASVEDRDPLGCSSRLETSSCCNTAQNQGVKPGGALSAPAHMPSWSVLNPNLPVS